jgi:hypothetical protein
VELYTWNGYSSLCVIYTSIQMLPESKQERMEDRKMKGTGPCCIMALASVFLSVRWGYGTERAGVTSSGVAQVHHPRRVGEPPGGSFSLSVKWD